MGDLPAHRVIPGRAFAKTGCNFAGPMQFKTRSGRGAKTEKVWICYFVCLATKACHIEPVTALSTDALLAAFRWFISRRGKPSDLHSDNGSNFHGADNLLRQFLSEAKNNERVASELSNLGNC